MPRLEGRLDEVFAAAIVTFACSRREDRVSAPGKLDKELRPLGSDVPHVTETLGASPRLCRDLNRQFIVAMSKNE